MTTAAVLFQGETYILDVTPSENATSLLRQLAVTATDRGTAGPAIARRTPRARLRILRPTKFLPDYRPGDPPVVEIILTDPEEPCLP